jgi:NADH:ubiquinone oxidoreductase subunit 5 (subunit L)/multisubunit Na+/H+ antiporter MnhA subunit
MIYQGLIERLSFGGRPLVIICLAAAMFGSGLTLAGFMKLLHATFLGQPSPKLRKDITEVSWTMWLPCVLLACLCVIFGVFANQIPMKYFILPAVGGGVGFIGNWYAGLSTLLILFGFFLGLFFFNFKALRPIVREDTAYVGGENLDLQETRVTGIDFYNTFKELKTLKIIYQQAQAGAFDIYEQGKTIVFGVGRFLQFLHNGVLPTYLVWTLLGMIALFFALVR